MCFDIDRFVDKKTASEFMCPICRNVLCCPQKGKTTPVSKQEATNDGHKYCDMCIKDALKVNKSCPECRRNLDATSLQPLDRVLTNVLRGLRIRCKYDDKGCKHEDELQLIESHERNCRFGFVPCNKCGALISASDANKHPEITCVTTLYQNLLQTKEDENMVLVDENKYLQDSIKDLKNEIVRLNGQNIKLRNELNNARIEIEERSKKKVSRRKIQELIDGVYGTLQPSILIDKPEIVELCRERENNYAKIQELIQNNANVNYKDKDGYSALICASDNGHYNIVKLLLDNGATISDKTNEGYNSLIFASYHGHIDVVKLLIEKGSDINEKTKQGYTALINASEKGHLRIVELLIKNRANVNIKDNNGQNALMWASKQKHFEVVKHLVENGALVKAKDTDGRTAYALSDDEQIKEYLKSKEAV